MVGTRVTTGSLAVVGISVGSIIGSGVIARGLNPARLAWPLTGETRSPYHGVPSQACILPNWGWQWLWQDHLNAIRGQMNTFKTERDKTAGHKKAHTLGL